MLLVSCVSVRDPPDRVELRVVDFRENRLLVVNSSEVPLIYRIVKSGSMASANIHLARAKYGGAPSPLFPLFSLLCTSFLCQCAPSSLSLPFPPASFF